MFSKKLIVIAFFVLNQYIIICLPSFTLTIGLQGMDLFSGIWGETVLLKIDERGFEVLDEMYL